MTVTVTVRSQWKKLVSLIRGDFNSSKCKTWAKMTTARIKLMRNKRESIVRQMRRDVALLLQSRQHATARIRVEHVIKEQNMMAANEILELFCERIVTRLSIIAKQRECPGDLKEAISSLIFAGPRCSDIPELLAIRDIFQKKYGKDFVSAATDLRPDCGVNRLLIEKLSVVNPPGELKLKVMKEIAKEYQVEWDSSETETELLKPPEERLEGPRNFVSAASLPMNSGAAPPYTEVRKPTTRSSSGDSDFQDVASAAKAAANSAKSALAAAQAAAKLAQKGSFDFKDNNLGAPNLDQYGSNPSTWSENHEDTPGVHGRYNRTQSLGRATNHSDNACSDKMDEMDFNRRRHSYNNCRIHTDIKFDDSDCDEETEMERRPSGMYQLPPHHATSNVKPRVGSSVHPKLPDCDALAARFEALKYSRR